MSLIRPLEIRDIDRIVALRRRVFAHSTQSSDASLASYYRSLFFENPWRSDRFPSFVHEETGQIRGFVGSIPRPMLLGAERLIAVTSTELMVAPEARGLVGPALFRRLFAGDQDITLSDRSNQQARALYESLGGTTVVWHSLYWTVPLDGSRLSFERAISRHGLVPRLLRRASNSLDRIGARFVRQSARQLPTRDEPLVSDTLVTALRRVAGPNSLIPDYDARTLDWLLQRVTESAGRVASAQVLLDGELIGWFIYAIRPDGEAQVVQLAALTGRHERVLDHLIQHAINQGGRVLKGRADRHFSSVLSDRGVPLTLGQPWTVVRARRPELMAHFLGGNTFFSRLDAEWWIGT